MAYTKFQICSRALTRIGANPIASFDDSAAQTESRVAGREWDPFIEGVLTEHPWKFATKDAKLVHIATPARLKFKELWQLPSDILDLHGIFLYESDGDDIPIPYERLEDKVATDYDETHELYARYVYKVPETLWPPYFVDLVTEGLEAVFTGALKRDRKLAEEIKEHWERVTKPIARNRDSQQQTSRKFPRSRLVAIRN